MQAIKRNAGMIAAFAAFLIILTVALAFGFYADQAMDRECKALGGHLDSHQETVVTSNGKTGTSTTNYCLSPDGRILKIY